MKKIKGFKMLLFAMAGLGPNLMMTLVTAYLNDALLADSVSPAKTFTGSCIVSALLCSVLFFAAKLIDAFIDVPLAWISDRLHTKFGKRRMSILIGFIPMTLSFILLWNPLILTSNPTGVSVIEALLLVVFYSSYTMCLVSYYACFAHIADGENGRVRLSQYKAFFDTVQYALSYALFPSLLLGLLGGSEPGAISTAMLKLSPVLVTMLIPLFIIKEEGFAEDVDENVPIGKSIVLSVKNREFRAWLITLFAMHMGLMLFLTGIGTTIPDGLLGLKGWQTTIMNSAAFAPVPLMLLIFNAIKKKHGLEYAFRTTLLVFAFSMFGFAFAWKNLTGSAMVSMIVGLAAATVGSYSIGAFFSTSYIFASNAAAREMAISKRDHSAMYFAVQGLVTQTASAIAVNLIYINIIHSEISVFGLAGGEVFVIPVLAGAFLLLAFALSFMMKGQNEAI